MAEIGYNNREKTDRALTNAGKQSAIRMRMAAFEIATLERISLFVGLNVKQLTWLHRRLYFRSFPAEKDVMISGMPGDTVYFILSGTVKVYVPQPDGGEVFVNILGPGDPVGEMSIVDQGGRSASVVTLEDTDALWMSQADFKEGLLSMPVMAQNLIRILSTRLRNLTGQFQAMAALDVNGRIVRQVLAFADRYGQPVADQQVVIPIRLTQNDLADLVGASRKRVNQAMVILKRNGWIAVDRLYHITIRDRAGLESLLE